MSIDSSKIGINRTAFREGLHDGIPIGLGYFAVSFALGVAARSAGMNPLQGFVVSLLCLASAGEYAGFLVIAAGSSYWEIALITLVANARYLLMSTAISQRLDPKMKPIHRFFIAEFITDEIFAVEIARPGYLNPFFTYGAGAVAAPLWALGTTMGIIAGNLMPVRAVSALSVALYGMFLAVTIPAARKDRVIAGLILFSYLSSWLFSVLPFLRSLSSGNRTIILTVALSASSALLFPAEEEIDRADSDEPRREIESQRSEAGP